MKLGSKVTVLIRGNVRPHPGRPFLRCYVIRILKNDFQLYDPVADWSWSCPRSFSGRVIVA